MKRPVRNVNLFSILLLLTLGFGNNLFAAVGGPDAYGYTYKATGDPGGPAYNWIEIATPLSGAGIPVSGNLSDLDDGYFYGIPLGFNFNFYGVVYDTIGVGSNGTIVFQDNYLGYGNVCPLPQNSGYTPQTFIAHFWDDLVLDQGDFPESEIYYQNFTDYTVIEYYHVSAYNDRTSTSTWEIIIYKNGNVVLQYQDAADIDALGSYTVGIQGDPSTGLLYSACDNAGTVSSLQAVEFYFPCNVTLNLGNDTITCGNYVLDAGNPGSTYAWSNGATSQTISVNATGAYSVTVTNGTCVASDTVNVTLTSPTVTNYNTCQGATVPAGAGLHAASNCGATATTITSFSGSIDNTDPTYNRSSNLSPPYSASGVGTAVHYDTYTFVVSTTGAYTFNDCGVANWDTHDAVYQAPFNPASPSTNFLMAGDDNGPACSSGTNTTVTLTAGVTYVYVAEAYSNSGTGAYTSTITGPGTVSSSVTPPLYWYTAATGGSPIDSGTTFNPIANPASGLANTNTVGSTTFYVACSNATACRTGAVFTVNPNPVVNLGNDTAVCGSTVTLDAGNPGATYAWSTGATTQTITTTTTNDYSVTVTALGCSTSDVVHVTNNTPPTISSVTANPGTICLGASSQLNVNANLNGSQQLSFSNNNRVSIPDNTSVGVTSGINVSGINPTTLTAGSLVSVCMNLTHTFDGDLQITLFDPRGDSIILSNRRGSSGDNFTNTCFSPSATTPIASGTAPFSGSYLPDGLPTSLGGNVNGLWTLKVTDLASGDTGSIINWTLTLNNVVQPQYNWSPAGSLSATNIANPVASPTATTTYSVTVTDPNTGCTTTGSTTVTLGVGTVSLGNDTVVCGTSLTLDAGNPGATYAWSNGASTETIVVTATGTYSVTVTSGSCTLGDTINVTIATPVVVNLGNDTAICTGTLVTLNAGNPGATYHWSNNANTQTITVGAGTYSVTVTNGLCSNVDTIVVSNAIAPTATNYTTCTGYTVAANQGLQATGGCGAVATPVTSFTGTISAGNTFDRSFSGTTYSASGRAVYYSTTTFTVSATGSYTFDLCGDGGSLDTYSSIYQAPFDPSNPDINFLSANDDGNSGNCSGGSEDVITLTAGTTYVYVATTYSNGATGPYVVDFTGPGTISTTQSIPLDWYTGATGGAPIASGTTFNPIGVAGSGLTNTNTAGTYNYYVACSNAPGCRTLATFTINQSPVVNLGNDTSTCAGPVTLNAGNAGATFAWSNGPSSQTIVASTTGTYSVTVTNANTCTSSDSKLVTVNALPVIASVTSTPGAICPGDSSHLLATATASGLRPLSFSNNRPFAITDNDTNGVTSAVLVSGIVPTTIGPNTIVSVCLDITHTYDRDLLIFLISPSGDSTTLANREGSSGDNYTGTCFTATATARLADSIAPFTGSYAPDSSFSSITGNANGVWKLRVVDVASGDTGTVHNWTLTLNSAPAPTYSWSPPTGLSATNIANPVARPTQRTTYTVTVTDAVTGCISTGTTTVDVNPVPVVNLGNDTTLCSGTLTLNAGNPGATYHWSNATSAQTTTVSTTDVYSVTVTNGTGCSASDSIAVTIGGISVNLGNDTTLCANSYVLDAGNPGATYHWSDNSTNRTLTATASGTYSVTVTLAGGCTASDAITLTLNTTPVVALTSVSQCGGTVTLDAGNPGSTYHWSDNSTNQTLVVTSTGTYSVTVSNGSCSASGSAVVTINPIPVVNLGNDTAICSGMITLDAGNAGATYHWSDNSTSQTLMVMSSGTYAVTVTGTGGCTASDNIVVGIGTPVVNLGNDTSICGGSFTLNAGNPGATYHWSDNSTGQTLVASQSGTYSVTVTASGGCSASDSITITIASAPVVNLGNDTATCGGSVTLNAGNAGSTYHWSDNSTGQTLVASSTGTYSVTVTNGAGCSASDAISVTINSTPTVNLGNDTTACSNALLLNAGNPGATYHWSDNSTNQTLVVTATGTYSVTVTIGGSCTATDAIQVTLNPSLTVNLGNDTTICSGSLTLNAGNPGATYLWTTLATTQTIDVSTTGTYGVAVTSGACTSYDTIHVTVGGVNVNLGPDVPNNGCIPDTLNAGNPGATYLWSNGATTQTIVTPANTIAIYSVTVTLNGCSGSDSITLGCEGIEELAFGTVNLYPNPSDGSFRLVMEQSTATGLNIEITAVTGQKVWTIDHENATGKYVREFNLQHLAKGVYYVRLISGKDVTVKRIVLQ